MYGFRKPAPQAGEDPGSGKGHRPDPADVRVPYLRAEDALAFSEKCAYNATQIFCDLNAKSLNPRHACMAVGEGLFGVLQHEDEVVYKHHESPNAGTDCGSTECGTIRLNHLNANSLNPRHA